MQIYSADVRKDTQEGIDQMIADFTAAGWELLGGFYFGNNRHHKFIQFIWNSDSPAVVPPGY